MLKKITLTGLLSLLIFTVQAGTYNGRQTKNIAQNDPLRTDGVCLSDEQTIRYLKDYFGVGKKGSEYVFNKSGKKYVEPAGIKNGQVVIIEVNDNWIGAKTNSSVTIGKDNSSSLFDQVKFGIKRITKVDNSVKTPSGTFYSVDLTTNRFFFAQRRSSHKDKYDYLVGGWYDEWSTIKSEKNGWKELDSSYGELQDGDPQTAPHNCDSSLELNHFTILDKNATGETEAISVFFYIPDKIDPREYIDFLGLPIPNSKYAIPYNFFYRANLKGELAAVVENQQYKANLSWTTSFDKDPKKFRFLANTKYNKNGKDGIKEYFDVWRVEEDGSKTLISQNQPEQTFTDNDLPVRDNGFGYDVTYYIVANVCMVDKKGVQGKQVASVMTNTVTLHVPGKEAFELKIQAGYTAKYLPSGTYGTSKNEYRNTVEGRANIKSPILQKGDVLRLYRSIEGENAVEVQTFTVDAVNKKGVVSYTLKTGSNAAVKGTAAGNDEAIAAASLYKDVFTAPAGMSQDATYQLSLIRGKDKYHSNIVKVPSYRVHVEALPCHRSGVPCLETCDPKEVEHNEIRFKPLADGNVASYFVYRDSKQIAKISQSTDATGQKYAITLPDAAGKFNKEAGFLTVDKEGYLTFADLVSNDAPVNPTEDIARYSAGSSDMYTVSVCLVDQKSTYGNNDVKTTYRGTPSELVINLNFDSGLFGEGVWDGRFTSKLTWTKIKEQFDVVAPVRYELYYREPGQTYFRRLHKTVYTEIRVDVNGVSKLAGFTAKEGEPVVLDPETTYYEDDYAWYGNKESLKGFGDHGFIDAPREYYVKAIFSERPALLKNIREKNSNVASPNGNIETLVEEIEAASDKVTVYPNPATEYAVVSNAAGINHVSVYNLAGVPVLDLEGNGDTEMTIEASDLGAGTYFVVINGKHTEKLILK